MVRVQIAKSLFEEVERKFGAEADRIFDLMESVSKNPNKGKKLGTVGGILIKELKYKVFRFYFLIMDTSIEFTDAKSLQELIIHFIRMSKKKNQQKTINEIKHILLQIGPKGFK